MIETGKSLIISTLSWVLLAPLCFSAMVVMWSPLWTNLSRAAARSLLRIAMQRCLDIALSFLLLVVLSPLMLLVAAVVRVKSGGPILTSQQRLGYWWYIQNSEIVWERTTFSLLSFCTDSTSARQRETVLHRLPHLLNVLQGDMGFFGPCPPPFYELNPALERVNEYGHRSQAAAHALQPKVYGLISVRAIIDSLGSLITDGMDVFVSLSRPLIRMAATYFAALVDRLNSIFDLDQTEARTITYLYIKRSLDILLSSILIVLLLPTLFVIAIAIRLDSPGSVLFVQQRVGARWRIRNGKVEWEIVHFPFLKFRSMYQSSDESVHKQHIQQYVRGALKAGEDENTTFKLSEDCRITRIGKIIRKTSLDELPQLLNVFRGDMSLVGPRPVPVYEFEEYEVWHRRRYHTPQGITGLWQVKGRGRVTFEEQMHMDIEYVEHHSLLLDFRILCQTVPVVISRRGAK